MTLFSDPRHMIRHIVNNVCFIIVGCKAILVIIITVKYPVALAEGHKEV